MALTHRQAKRTPRRTTRKPRRATLDNRQVIARIDAMIRELQAMRRELATVPQAESKPNLVEDLFGALGHGTWDEYDLNLDWARFSE